MVDDDAGFDAHYERLLASLDDAADLLTAHGETRWAGWLQREREAIAGGDRYALNSLLSAFGGMGSFNDLVIHPLNGHTIEADEIDPVNERLQAQRGVIHHAAKAMKRELDRG